VGYAITNSATTNNATTNNDTTNNATTNNATTNDATRVVQEVPDLTKKKKTFWKKMSLFLYIVSF
jgi:tRNA pseudouridine38-40 synthase